MLMDYGSIGWQDFCGGDDIRNGARYTPILFLLEPLRFRRAIQKEGDWVWSCYCG